MVVLFQAMAGKDETENGTCEESHDLSPDSDTSLKRQQGLAMLHSSRKCFQSTAQSGTYDNRGLARMFSGGIQEC